jgi:transcriptional regulator with XRE-family HTH domain
MYVKTNDAATWQNGTGTSSVSMRSNMVAAISLATCFVGTMGGVTPAMLAQSKITSNSGVQFRYVMAQPGEAQATPIALQPTPIDDLARIRQVLKPTVLELANLFGVSRQAVYDWQSGAQPKSGQTALRLAELARAADVFALSDVTVNPQTLHRKVTGGVTVLDAVMNGDNAVELARKLVKILQRENSQRVRMAAQLAGRKSVRADSSDYGSPRLDEKI